ncbi:unnamed protein product [Caenorhabditis brenneri]
MCALRRAAYMDVHTANSDEEEEKKKCHRCPYVCHHYWEVPEVNFGPLGDHPLHNIPDSPSTTLLKGLHDIIENTDCVPSSAELTHEIVTMLKASFGDQLIDGNDASDYANEIVDTEDPHKSTPNCSKTDR